MLDSAMLVRGECRYSHFRKDIPSAADFDPAAITRWEEMDRHRIETHGTM